MGAGATEPPRKDRKVVKTRMQLMIRSARHEPMKSIRAVRGS